MGGKMLPIPRRRWLEREIRMSTPKSCVEVILKDC